MKGLGGFLKENIEVGSLFKIWKKKWGDWGLFLKRKKNRGDEAFLKENIRARDFKKKYIGVGGILRKKNRKGL